MNQICDCGWKNDAGKCKFCPECGKKIQPVCVSCNTDLLDSAKFCQECGYRVKELTGTNSPTKPAIKNDEGSNEDVDNLENRGGKRAKKEGVVSVDVSTNKVNLPKEHAENGKEKAVNFSKNDVETQAEKVGGKQEQTRREEAVRDFKNDVEIQAENVGGKQEQTGREEAVRDFKNDVETQAEKVGGKQEQTRREEAVRDFKNYVEIQAENVGGKQEQTGREEAVRDFKNDVEIQAENVGGKQEQTGREEAVRSFKNGEEDEPMDIEKKEADCKAGQKIAVCHGFQDNQDQTGAYKRKSCNDSTESIEASKKLREDLINESRNLNSVAGCETQLKRQSGTTEEKPATHNNEAKNAEFHSKTKNAGEEACEMQKLNKNGNKTLLEVSQTVKNGDLSTGSETGVKNDDVTSTSSTDVQLEEPTDGLSLPDCPSQPKMPVEHDDDVDADASSEASIGNKDPVSKHTRSKKHGKQEAKKLKQEKKMERKQRAVERKKPSKDLGPDKTEPHIETEEKTSSKDLSHPLSETIDKDVSKIPGSAKESQSSAPEISSNKQTKKLPSLSSRSAKADDTKVEIRSIMEPAHKSGTKFGIVFGDPIGDWKIPELLEEESTTINGFKIFCRTFYLPRWQYGTNGIPYKYVLFNEKGQLFWEDNQRSSSPKGITNRCLKLSKHAIDQGAFSKYDDLVLFSQTSSPEEGTILKGIWKGVKSFFKSEVSHSVRPTLEEEFLLCADCYIPTWHGFGYSIPELSETAPDNVKTFMKAREAINKFADIIKCLTESKVLVDGHSFLKYQFSTLQKTEIFKRFFEQKIVENWTALQENSGQPENSQNTFQTLISGISIAHLYTLFVENDWSSLREDLLLALINNLSLRKLVCTGWSRLALEVKLKEEFGTEVLRNVRVSLHAFLLRTVERYGLKDSTVVSWSICALIRICDSILQSSLDLSDVTNKLKRMNKCTLVSTEAFLEIEAAAHFDGDQHTLILSSMDLKSLRKIAASKIFDIFDILECLEKYIAGSRYVSEVDEIKESVKQLVIRCQDIEYFKTKNVNWFLDVIGVIFKLLTCHLEKISLKKQEHFCNCLVILSETVFSKVDISLSNNKIQMEKILKESEREISKGMKKISDYVEKQHYVLDLGSILRFLDMLLKWNLTIGSLKELLETKVVGICKQVTTKNMEFPHKREKLLTIVCDADSKTTSAKMLEVFEQVAFDIVDIYSTETEHKKFYDVLSTSSKFKMLLWKMTEKHFGEPEPGIKKLLEWPLTLGMIKLNEESKDKEQPGRKRFIAVLDNFKLIEQRLKDATITVEELHVIHEMQKQFCNIAVMLSGSRDGKEKLIHQESEKAIALRWREFFHFSNWRRMVEKIVWLCEQPRGLTVEMSELKAQLEVDIQKSKLCDLCCEYEGDFEIRLYNLPENLDSKMSNLHKLSSSRIFTAIWNLAGHWVKGSISLSDVVESVYDPVLSKLVRFVENLFKETITLNEIGRILKDYNGPGKTQELGRDLKWLVDTLMKDEECLKLDGDYSYNDDAIDEIVKKIGQFFKLQISQKKADDLIRTGRKLNLNGNFAIYEEIEQKMSVKKGELKSLNQSHFDAANSLRMVTDEMGKCLSSILQSSSLILWLREKLDGLKDVKTFVDLMSISAGESDYEADRVSCLHTVCLSFKPIIFELNEDSGPIELIDCCTEVLKEIKDDPSLPEKLLDCNRHLEWFKKERESYGSIATSSMMETEAANHRGYYIVGAIQDTSKPKSLENRTLENSLRLIVPEQGNGGNAGSKSDSEDRKTYSFDEIRDLQSKLMLIGGNEGREREMGQREKDCFLRMFGAVSRVAIACVNLCKAGYLPFLTWRKEFRCCFDSQEDFERNVTVIEEHWNEMEEKLSEWKKELHQKRWKHSYLNFFTIQQLMYLQNELHPVLAKNSNLKAARKLPTNVFTLLEAIYPEINKTIFKDAVLKSSHTRHFGNLDTRDDDWKCDETDESKFVDVSVEAIENFIRELEDQIFDEDLAKAATLQCGIKDCPDAVAWAFENGENESLIEELASRMDKVLTQKKEDELIAVEPKSALTANENTLENDTTESIFGDAAPFLSLDELGVFLAELGNHGKLKTIKRKRCEFMLNSKPNVMVVPKDDLLISLLDVYRGVGNCLPRAEEVVVCSSATSAEEIELLFRRALIDPIGLYSLAFVDKLDYNVSEQAYRMQELLCKERVSMTKDSGYNLLILCASGKEDGSFLASALHSCRIASPPCPRVQEMKNFLADQLKVNASADASKYVHAAAADADRYSVRVVKSNTSGTGKSLYVRRVGTELEKMVEKSNLAMKQIDRSFNTNHIVTTPLHGTSVKQDEVVESLLPYEKTKEDAFPRIFHFDIASTVVSHLDSFLFNLIVLGSVAATDGRVWRKRSTDLYMIEITEVIQPEKVKMNDKPKKLVTNTGTVIPLFPTTVCQTPKETHSALEQQRNPSPGFDVQELRSEAFQRVYQYLKTLDANNAVDRFKFNPAQINANPYGCLHILLRYCGVEKPSWREVKNFVHFFNNQLADCENSIFCQHEIVGDTLPCFKTFVVKFMLQMSKDFATPSVDDTEARAGDGLINLRRRWERSEHPYLFFNQGGVTMSFLGFTVNQRGDLMDRYNSRCIAQSIMSADLYRGLHRQGVELFSNYESWTRIKKLEVLCQVMGIAYAHDPDVTYELTMDNVMKILAIHMRFRSGIPVIIMGETGCGKTHLIRFMCKLKAGPGGPNNMLLVKVHGGISKEDIRQRVDQAVKLAQENRHKLRDIETVLFFDEANTTDAIGLIKEVMCDQRIDGKPLNLASCGLQIIAACNPYRKHSNNMIFRLESAGLGYHVKAENAAEKLGNIPLRQLVYRVHPLPDSMLPLVWDFGQLSDKTEQVYTKQIVNRYAYQQAFPSSNEFVELVVQTLSYSQKYMRNQENECSFVSLRDVERAVQVMSWFYSKMDQFLPLVEKTKERICPAEDDSSSESDEEEEEDEDILANNQGAGSVEEKCRMALVLSLNVCYAARLEERDSYYQYMGEFFKGRYALLDGWKQIKDEVYYCQQMFLDQLKLGDDIAKNTALCENVFMMVVCIELRIPLFIVGKPGSSKSLAKTIIQDNMQGSSSYSELFKTFKEILMCSYQCSPLSTTEGIIGTFKQCSRFQEGKNLETFASVVVLDEVGLAEDSPRMPLKALHPLLEDGTDGSEDLMLEGKELKSKRVAFVGISNWALDPAKMNRGLMLTRGQPDKKELINSAEGICNSHPSTKERIDQLFLHLSEAYLKIYEQQKKCKRLQKSKKEEFFGLRDYYSLIKMVFNRAKSNEKFPMLHEIKHAVKRNFGGLEEIDIWQVFRRELLPVYPEDDKQVTETLETNSSSFGLLSSSLRGNEFMKDTRYLLLLTENYAALRVLEKTFPDVNQNANVIFGSSFPKDQEFTQICRDINKIKICMETGMTVILLNMENLYESLYDALNQYYIYLGGQRYVDLGLGTHRVKCRVHENFKLIVIAEKDTVYRSFPIPLINRLEKHFLVMSTMMNDKQLYLSKTLHSWAEKFSTISHGRKKYSIGDAFIGYNEDTAAAVILETFHELGEDAIDQQVLSRSEDKLLESATPEAVTRLKESPLSADADKIWDVYFNEQHHSSLSDFLLHSLQSNRSCLGISAQVTTFSRLLSPHDQLQLSECLEDHCTIKCISLSQFQTEQQFSEETRLYMQDDRAKSAMLIVQCDRGDDKANLIACARHLCEEARKLHANQMLSALHIIFIVNLTRVAGGCQYLGSFHGVNWLSVHIDELRPSCENLPSLVKYANYDMSHLFETTAAIRKEAEAKKLLSTDATEGSSNVKEGSADVSEGSAVVTEASANVTERSLVVSEESADATEGSANVTERSLLVSEGSADVTEGSLVVSEESADATEGSANVTERSLLVSEGSADVTEGSLVVSEGSADATEGSADVPEGSADVTEGSADFIEEKFALQLGLLRRCVQASVADAVSQSNGRDAERTTKRIHILLDILSPKRSFTEGSPEYIFAETLMSLVHRVLKQKELQSIDGRNKWFQDEAVNGNNIQECGTFRRALSYRIEKEVVPIFSKFITKIDANGNFDLLCQNWRRGVWLDLFCCSDILCLDYEEIVAPPVSKLPKRKLRDPSFHCWFPFSNVVCDKISTVIHAHQNNDAETNSEEVVHRTLEQTQSGQCLLSLHPRDTKAYLRDLVFLEFNVSETQLEIVACSIIAHIRGRKREVEQKPADIVDLHLAISDPVFHQRVQCFLDLTDVMPHVAPDVKRIIADADVVMDVVALLKCLEHLMPNYEELLEEQTRFVWCRKVHEVKLGTNQLLDLIKCNQSEFSGKALHLANKVRLIWTRLQIMRMFIEHVCPPGIPCAPADVAASLQLWQILDNLDDELSTAKSWLELENFLKQITELSDLGTDENKNCTDCFICMEIMEDPVQLPCKHVICYLCLQTWEGKDKNTCPICSVVIPADFKIPEEKDRREMSFQLGEFKRRCIAFFMEVVSNFCFSSKRDTDADPEVVDLMMSYVTTEKKETKALSPFREYGVDPIPTVRSFLIQQLLKMRSNEQVHSYLQKYLDSSQGTQYDIQSRLELCSLVVHCIEDLEMADVVSKGSNFQNLLAILSRKLEKIRPLGPTDVTSVTDVASLRKIAEMRATLSKMAEIVYCNLIENSIPPEEDKLSKVYSILKDICLRCASGNPRFFFLRQLLRIYGSNAMREIVKVPEFEWLWPEDCEEESQLLADKFLVYGKEYKEMRDLFGESILGGNIGNLEKFLKEENNSQSSDATKSGFIYLSVFREITSGEKKPNEEFCSSLVECLNSSQFIHNTKLLQELVENAQDSNFEKLKLAGTMNQRDREIAELIIHTQIVLSVKSNVLLLQPICLLMQDPNAMTNSFLPTMPDDHLVEVMEAGHPNQPFAGWVTYQCPNGHPYVVTECGQPMEQRGCPECGANIGGLNHTPTQGNVQAARVDRTAKGHTLGDPGRRLDFPVPERQLSKTSLCVIRVLLHSTLLLASCQSANNVANLIHPPVPAGSTRKFFWDHLIKDIGILAKAIGKSADDAVLLMHVILAGMLRNQEDGDREDFRTIDSRECRKQWELKFDTTFVKPSLANLSTRLDEVREEVINDKRLGTNPVMRHLYELDIEEQTDSLELPAHDYVRFWRYRTPISVDHLKISLSEFIARKGKERCQMLQKFLDEEKLLRLVHKLPEVLKLQGIMSRYLNQRIHSDEKRSIKDVVNEFFKGEKKNEINKLLRAYYSLWRTIQPMMLSNREVANSEHFNHNLSSNSPICYILPSTIGAGLTALTAVDYLARAHNELIESTRRIQGDQTEIKRVALQDVTLAHLVAYDHDEELLPMLYAHCDYSLEVGKGTNIDYNFPALERQLVDTFIRGKPLIDVKLQRIKFVDELNSFSLLQGLERKVDQIQIPFEEQFKMTAEFPSLSEVCDALRAAQIALGLLAATGAKPDGLYMKYLEDVLRMPVNQFLVSGKMQSVCRLAHVRSIWLMLNVERAFRLYHNQEDPFNVAEMFREKLDECDSQLTVLRNVDVDHLISELTEYMILELQMREENALDYPLKDCLEDYADRKSSKAEIRGLESIPDSICLKHVYDFWLLVAKAFSKHKKI